MIPVGSPHVQSHHACNLALRGKLFYGCKVFCGRWRQCNGWFDHTVSAAIHAETPRPIADALAGASGTSLTTWWRGHRTMCTVCCMCGRCSRALPALWAPMAACTRRSGRSGRWPSALLRSCCETSQPPIASSDLVVWL